MLKRLNITSISPGCMRKCSKKIQNLPEILSEASTSRNYFNDVTSLFLRFVVHIPGFATSQGFQEHAV
jgi:hypothetical protein